jgi:hypothetical protein
VTAPLSDALPHSTVGLRLLLYTAWLHYAVGISVGNCVKIAAASLGFTVSPGGLTQGWMSLARRLEGGYEDILQKIRTSAVLHADETGWRVNGVTHWLWAFATRLHCYYLIDRHRSTRVVQAVLGTVFPGILITDFWSAYHALQTLAKQKCYFHLFTELLKVDKLSTGPPWQGFRKKLARLLRDAVRLGQAREKLPAKHYERRKARLHRRLDAHRPAAKAQPHRPCDAARPQRPPHATRSPRRRTDPQSRLSRPALRRLEPSKKDAPSALLRHTLHHAKGPYLPELWWPQPQAHIHHLPPHAPG